MAEADEYDPFDDLDAFFNAAASEDGNALQEAAENVAGQPRRSSKTASLRPDIISDPELRARVHTKIKRRGTAVKPKTKTTVKTPSDDLAGKFVAVAPEAEQTPGEQPGEPFVLIPAHIHNFLPWWGWATIGLGLAVMILGVVLAPEVNLERVVARLGDANQGNVQSAMRQLVINGDDRTVSKLFGLAVSAENDMETRLRAVDTLGLIQTPGADRALLRLELGGNTDAQVREAAVAARRQRDSAKTAERNR